MLCRTSLIIYENILITRLTYVQGTYNLYKCQRHHGIVAANSAHSPLDVAIKNRQRDEVSTSTVARRQSTVQQQ